MTSHDIRWRQRSSNYRRALARLAEAVALSGQRPLSDLERQGLIQAFEFTHELSWKTLKDFLASRGIEELYGSRDTTREAFAQGLITDGEAWMDMIKARNLTSHTYNPEVADSVTRDILMRFYPAFAEQKKRRPKTPSELSRDRLREGLRVRRY
jgi:nucleotidyltransferase substrate binding protein (TIGR01987 family)